jgi:hypothetical protein
MKWNNLAATDVITATKDSNWSWGMYKSLRIGRICGSKWGDARRKGGVVRMGCVCFTSGNWKLQDEWVFGNSQEKEREREKYTLYTWGARERIPQVI